MKAHATFVLTLVGASFCATGAFALDKVVLQSDWLPSGDKAPPYVALQEGFFAQEGLDVTILSGRGAVEALTKTATGAADVSTGGLGALMSAAVETPLPVRAVYSVYTKPPESLFTTQASKIATIKDLVGRSVAASALSSSRVVWPLVLKQNGVEEQQIKMKFVDAAAIVPMLAAGQADAISTYLTTAPAVEKILQAAGKQLRVLPWSDFGLEGYSTALFASDKMIASRPDVLKRFVRAYRRGVAFTVANAEAAAVDIKKSAPDISLDASVIADQVRAAIPLMKNEIADRDGLGAFEPSLVKTTWEWVARSQNYAEDRIKPDDLIDRAFLPPS